MAFGLIEVPLYKHNLNVIRTTSVVLLIGGKGSREPKAQTAGAYPGFLSMKHAEEYCHPLPHPEREASPSQGYPHLSAAVSRRCPFIQLGEERQSGVKFLI